MDDFKCHIARDGNGTKRDCCYWRPVKLAKNKASENVKKELHSRTRHIMITATNFTSFSNVEDILDNLEHFVQIFLHCLDTKYLIIIIM